jgi:N-acetylmuramoyl-L-alanine amidase
VRGAADRRSSRLLAVAVVALTSLLVAGCATTPGPAGRPGASQADDPATAESSPAPGHVSSPDRHRSGPASGPAAHSHQAKPLAGKIVGIDPGHNGRNGTDPAYLAQQVFNGRTMENCDTTGTQTAAGYTESRFNFNVAMYLATDLRQDGAHVVLTRWNNRGLGPCVNKRATILNRTDVTIDIHADGGPTWGRGFTVLEPVADGPNNKVIAPSVRFGRYVHQAFLADTPMRVSDYYGHDGYQFRNDLAGLNLTTVPKVLIECGNMPNPADAALLSSARVQRVIARALEAAIVRFLRG